ncbi:protein GLUTAMINE DUMPER 2 [Vitis vinifera]|uniref:Protein glutamine dumper 2 n=1 Tax=Vitis vinifera TaxID=29760 RepID=A0A438JBP4_VITVI|nr:protein GLUTAMINE DUMPER 2 [Vitis vinifera]RVX06363.1 Protein glutamine dumper 2 [Vitis vinifera]|eukprot:XP_003633748.1 PREDICTED: protein GLUTAMINE DUMPER 2-like [Vitis vinifera]
MMAADTTSSNGFWQLNSPLPYLFVGLALLLGVIAVALIILSCSHKQPPADLATDDDKDKPPKPMHTDPDTVLVVMAGDDSPKYLAKPMASTTHTEQV